MKTYIKPTLQINNHMFEGIYMASGEVLPGDGSVSTTTTKCGSKYMNGVFVVGTYNSIVDGYKVGRGCEGCPANWGRCAVNECNYAGDFRPSWEKAGHLPDELGY